MPIDDSTVLRFGRFELQPRERLLLADGKPVSLGSRTFDLLATLAARSSHLVSKRDLLDLVWPGLVVEESNLHTQISTLRRLLGNDTIATVPGRGYRFVAATEAVSLAPATPSGPDPASSLPTMHGRLFGRDDDLARLAVALETSGCTTLVGAGGVGKTRLALAAAARWTGRLHWVDLSSLTASDQISGAVARAAGLTVADGDLSAPLVETLGMEPVLLVLDNAEHIVDATAALVSLLVARLPQLRLLVTSQLPLAVPGERVQRIDPLTVEDDATPDDGALALLAERIRNAGHRGRLDADALAMLREIARDLDGLPLALEMAAARVPLLGLQGVRDHLVERFALLKAARRPTGSRHRSLQAALDWSVELLEHEERELLCTLGVFAGGFTLELCVALMEPETASRWAVIDSLATLVDRSLVAVSDDDPPRYRLLETMRAYAAERLATTGVTAGCRRRHAEIILACLRANVSTEAGRRVCLVELDNAREAIGWATVHDLAAAAALTACVVEATTFSPWRAQSHAWMLSLESRMRSPESDVIPIAGRVHWWNEFARSSIINMNVHANEIARYARALAADHDDAEAMFMATIAVVRSLHLPDADLDEACTALRQLAVAHPDVSGRVRLATIGALAFAAGAREDPDHVLELRRDEVALARELGMDGSADAAESNVITALFRLERYQDAHQASRALLERLSGTRSLNLLWAWYGVVVTLVALGRPDEATRELLQALPACRHLNLPILTTLFCTIAHAQQRHAVAAQLAGYARAVYEQRHFALYGAGLDVVITAETAATGIFGREQREVLVDSGRRLTDEAALALLCDDLAADRPAARRTPG